MLLRQLSLEQIIATCEALGDSAPDYIITTDRSDFGIFLSRLTSEQIAATYANPVLNRWFWQSLSIETPDDFCMLFTKLDLKQIATIRDALNKTFAKHHSIQGGFSYSLCRTRVLGNLSSNPVRRYYKRKRI